MERFLLDMLMSGAGVTILLMALKRLVDKAKFGEMCFRAGQAMSKLGQMRFGRPFYEPLEEYFQDLLKFGVDRFSDGLNTDDVEVKEEPK